MSLRKEEETTKERTRRSGKPKVVLLEMVACGKLARPFDCRASHRQQMTDTAATLPQYASNTQTQDTEEYFASERRLWRITSLDTPSCGWDGFLQWTALRLVDADRSLTASLRCGINKTCSSQMEQRCNIRRASNLEAFGYSTWVWPRQHEFFFTESKSR